MREAYTAVLCRAEAWAGTAYTEPYEVGWAGEAIVFVRAVETDGGGGELALCISPDGSNWVDEGTTLPLPRASGEVTFAKLDRFGHFVRFRARMPEAPAARFMVTLALKE